MFYQKIIPIKPLQQYIRYFWVLEDCGDKAFKIIPDGSPGIIFQETPNLFLDKRNQLLPQLFLYGQTTLHSEQLAVGNFKNIGVYLQPTALKSIFNIDAYEFTDQLVPIDCLITEHFLEELLHTDTIKHKIDTISQFLLKRIQKIAHTSQKADYAVKLLQNGHPLKHIQTAMNLSERSLERLIRQYAGLSPKLFSRIIRFQSGLQCLRQKEICKLTDLAYQKEYFDQSHYNREFKAFTGLSPKQYLQQTREHVENFPEWKV